MSRRLSVQDKLALMMTSAGSQRRLAELIGVSHQRVGRWLTIGQTLPDGTPSRVREPAAPELLAAIEQAYAMHVEVAREQARVDRIPFSADAPVYARRLPLRDGTPGGRVIIEHMHRMRDDLRHRTVATAHKSRKYYAVSVGSRVNLRRYNRNADTQIKDRIRVRDFAGAINRELFRLDEKQGYRLKTVHTPLTPMAAEFPADLINGEIDYKLRQRHEPAVGDEGTTLADRMILQLRSDDRFAREHEQRKDEARRERQAVAAKARRDKAKARRNR